MGITPGTRISGQAQTYVSRFRFSRHFFLGEGLNANQLYMVVLVRCLCALRPDKILHGHAVSSSLWMKYDMGLESALRVCQQGITTFHLFASNIHILTTCSTDVNTILVWLLGLHYTQDHMTTTTINHTQQKRMMEILYSKQEKEEIHRNRVTWDHASW